MRLFLLVGAASLAFGTHASAAQEVSKTTVTASNGVVVTKSADDFAKRFEYSSPAIKARSLHDAAVGAAVTRVSAAGKLLDIHVQGYLVYSGEWRHFDHAVFRGGATVNYTKIGSEVGSCRGGCTLVETFVIQLTPTEVAKYAENGSLPIQVRSQGSDTALLEIPVSYIDAVNEVGK